MVLVGGWNKVLGMLCPMLGLKVFPGKVCIVTKKRTVGPWCDCESVSVQYHGHLQMLLWL